MQRPAALSAVDLLAAYAAGTHSPVDVVADVATVVAAREPTLNALAADDLGAAHDRAAASERRYRDGIPEGPLDGVPVTVKENLGRAGVPMQLGNAGVTPVVPVRSSPVVERLEEAGAIVIGSTTMPDWGMLSSGVSSLHGITRSPWDESLTTGGSSAGAGAAAAAGYGPLHVGTDIGGSIRLPGTWLGLTTLKPSAGRVPLDVPYLGRVAGPITRSADDAALLLSVISRPDARDWTSLPPEALPAAPRPLDPVGLRVGLHLDAGCGLPVEPEVRTAVEEAAAAFADAGAVVTPLEPFMRPSWLDDLDQFWRVRSLSDLDVLDAAARERVLPFIRRWAEAGRGVDGIRVVRDYASIMAVQQATVAATEAYDLVLSPVAPVPAFPAEWPMPWGDGDAAMPHIGFTAPYNLSGQPAGTTNCGFTADGRTIGVQVSGRRFDDVGVLAALAWFEAHRPDTMCPRWPIRS
ncbi:amidase [Terrabacter carboxydivorans]|uniref:Amidase n=1 Tax=Terrabacter carboxydivorans TaxID=619730 RepID=A0ABP5YED1_9MICO